MLFRGAAVHGIARPSRPSGFRLRLFTHGVIVRVMLVVAVAVAAVPLTASLLNFVATTTASTVATALSAATIATLLRHHDLR